MKNQKFKLPAAFTNKWQKELRSGKYQQTQDTLLFQDETGTGYCCLGVAGKMCGIGDQDLDEHELLSELEDITEMGIPQLLINQRIPNESNDLETVFASLNDAKGYSFDQIADWIDENIEKI